MRRLVHAEYLFTLDEAQPLILNGALLINTEGQHAPGPNRPFVEAVGPLAVLSAEYPGVEVVGSGARGGLDLRWLGLPWWVTRCARLTRYPYGPRSATMARRCCRAW